MFRKPFTAQDADRFWSKVDKSDGCWLWRGALFSNGYGQVSRTGGGIGAHRVSWFLAYGPIPDGLFVCHRCDNPPCVNPDHLFLGTAKDNRLDMMSKGKTTRPSQPVRGEMHFWAKLTEDDVRSIRDLAAIGQTQRAIAGQFHIAPSRVCDIVNRRSWAHVRQNPKISSGSI